jgi:hypothetical protein
MNPIAIYQSPSGTVDVRLDGDTVWLSQKQMSELFAKNVRTVSEHIRNVFKDGELQEDAVVRNFRITAADGKGYDTTHYNLDVIISVGYRVKSPQGVQFRQWATRLLREHLTLGYTVNRQRFEANAAELEAALNLIHKAAQTPELSADTGRGLLEIVTRACPAGGRVRPRAKRRAHSPHRQHAGAGWRSVMNKNYDKKTPHTAR